MLDMPPMNSWKGCENYPHGDNLYIRKERFTNVSL